MNTNTCYYAWIEYLHMYKGYNNRRCVNLVVGSGRDLIGVINKACTEIEKNGPKHKAVHQDLWLDMAMELYVRLFPVRNAFADSIFWRWHYRKSGPAMKIINLHNDLHSTIQRYSDLTGAK